MLSLMENWRPGALNRAQLVILCKKQIIKNADFSKFDDHSSFDLHITNLGYRLAGCVKPHQDYDVLTLIKPFEKETITFAEGKVSLEKGETYIFRVKEALNLKGTHLWGQATGKSTYGRLDILTRLLTDRGNSYDVVKEDYTGSLWIEITPITFSIKIKAGDSLNQLRLIKGASTICSIDRSELLLWGNLIFDENGNTKKDNPHELTLNLFEDPRIGNRVCAFVAKQREEGNSIKELDLTVDFPPYKGYYDYPEYWEILRPTEISPLSLKIEKEKFYILRSRERFKLPESVCIYCQAVTETLGELRIHYAGFVHPCFGADREDDKGAPLIFEVRGHNIDIFLQHGEILDRLDYYFMSQDAQEDKEKVKSKSPYDNQELTLSKFFKP